MTAQPAESRESTRVRNVAGLVSGALVAFGILCWIAANWAAFHRLTKLGLVGCALLVAATGAALVPRARVPALIVATAATGGLLALIGQIYPSGADAWQLFFYWALLALPFALAARHDAAWSLWVIVAITAIQLWNVQEGNFETNLVRDWAPAWALSIAIALGLRPTTISDRILGGTRSAFRIAAVSAIGLVLVTGIAGIVFDKHEASVLVGLALLGLTIAGLSRQRPFDLGLLAIAMLAFEILLIGRVAILIAPKEPDIGGMLLISVLAVGVIGASVVLLRRLSPDAATSETDTEQAPGDRPTWPLAVLSGVGAVIAAIPLVSLFGLVLESFAQDNALVIGGVTLAIAILLMRRSAIVGFLQMFGAIGVATGIAMIALGSERTADKDIGFLLGVIMMITAALVPVTWTRAVLGFASAAALLASTAGRMLSGHVTAFAIIVSLVTCVGAVALLARTYDKGHVRLMTLARNALPFVTGFVGASLLALMLLAGRPFMVLAAGTLGGLREEFLAPATGAAQILSVALGLSAAALFFAQRPAFRTPEALALAAVAVVFATRSPMLGAALFVLACAIVVGTRAVAVFAAIAVLWIVSAEYYALSWTLTEKAWSMVALGLALAAVLLATARKRQSVITINSTRSPSVRARLLIAFGVLATGVLATFAVVSAEEILRNGRQVYLALRPVDPRSLLQGDYMAVAFDTTRLAPPATARNREVFAIASLDGRSVATPERIALPAEARDNEIALRLRTKSRRWFVGSDAWYFEEGTGKAFEAAKFGVFRIGGDGRPLLVGLADANLRVLP